jgi:hypothetical protein
MLGIAGNPIADRGNQAMDVEFLSKASSWANAAVVVFTVLAVVAGVAAWHFSSQYRDAKDAAFERFKLESSLSIAESAARAAEATRKASEAREGAAKAVAEATIANERAETLESEASKQRERAEQAEKRLFELEARTKPRQISEEQRTRLMTLLRAASPKGLVGLGCVRGDAEGGVFAEQISEVLKAAGWTTTGIVQDAYNGGNPAGLFVLVKSASTAPAHAAVLQRAFKEAGIQLPAYTKSNLGAGDVHIIIGPKP